ncbi:hypothetical protein QJS04_geneDACA003293 [Acorus gramineus]|uniref:Myb/SANT-like domain-containing protein n=1 Tax=Acorus gramineus TaxID=55184 RepID=A0AAV9BQS6_ACOGR|nr:hypothetical protein QJS04_geneDACA003293 [Acorus gramineus]
MYRKKAVWDSHKYEVFISICLEEVQAGNKPSQTLNKVGYMNLSAKFNERCGIIYEKDQLKNHWDTTRKDWQMWKALQKETGLGWDEQKKTYKMPHEWWSQFAQRHIGGDKFAHFPLAHEEELDILFGHGAAIGDHNKIPSGNKYVWQQEKLVSPTTESVAPSVEKQQETEALPSETPLTEPSGANQSNGVNLGSEATSPLRAPTAQRSGGGVKRSKASTGQVLETSLDRIYNLLEERTRKKSSVKSTEDVPTVVNALQVLANTEGLSRSSEEYLFAIGALRLPVNRQTFCSLDTDELRARWIAHEYKLSRDTS